MTTDELCYIVRLYRFSTLAAVSEVNERGVYHVNDSVRAQLDLAIMENKPLARADIRNIQQESLGI
jgi:hypothetical protein